MNSSGFLNIYATDDPEGKKTAIGLLSTLIILSYIPLLAILVLRLIADFHLYTADIALITLLFLFSYFYLLLRRGLLLLTSVLFFSVTWVAITVMAVMGTGIRDVTVLGYILIIFIAVLINGYRLAIIFATLTLVSFWIIAVAEAEGIIIPPWEPPLVYARDFTFFIILVLTGILLYQRSSNHSYTRINREIAERKKAEEKLSQNERSLIRQNEELLRAKLKAEESDRLKTAFLQNISHEIRTPMNGIVGFSDLLKDKNINREKADEYIKIIMLCSDQLASIVNDLIDISKIEVGAVELNISEFSSEALLNDIRILFGNVASEKGLIFEVRNDLPGYAIRSDRGKINKILNNLVSNAIKFTPEGTVQIHAWKDGDNFKVKVSDTGIGIRKDILPFIFDRFRQAETGMTRSFGGSGLGLAICKGNLDYLEGTINLMTEEGKGSVFSVSIPVEFHKSATGNQPEQTGIIPSRRIKVLIAEDDEISFLYLESILKKGNIDIIRAMDGQTAISLFDANTDLAVIIMDLKLPVISGFEAARRIKEKNNVIPLIAISAYAFDEDRKRAAAYGFEEYITKPVDKKILTAILNKLLNKFSDVNQPDEIR